MEPTYLTRVENGITKLYEVQYKSTLPQEVLHGTCVMQDFMPFTYDNRHFWHKIFANGKYITHVIKCDLLYSKMPVIYKGSSDTIHLVDPDYNETNTEVEQQSIGIEDVTMIIHTGDNASTHNHMYIFSNDTDRAALTTNVFDDGRMCFEQTFPIATAPQNIIATYESAPGNNHLLVDHENDMQDQRQCAAKLYANKNGVVCIRKYEKNKLNHEQIKYTS